MEEWHVGMTVVHIEGLRALLFAAVCVTAD